MSASRPKKKNGLAFFLDCGYEVHRANAAMNSWPLIATHTVCNVDSGLRGPRNPEDSKNAICYY